MAMVMTVLANHVDAASSSVAQAPTQLFDFHIGRTHLSTALRAFAEQTHLQFAGFSDASPVDPLVGPLSGVYSQEDALALLLDGTGLTYRFVNSRTIAIVGQSDSMEPPKNQIDQSPVSNSIAPSASGTEIPPDQHRSFLSRLVCLFAICGSVAAGGVHAQSAPAQTALAAPADTGAPVVGLEEIVVTAEKRSETASKTPLAITVISGDELLKDNVQSVVQLQYMAPSLAVTQTGQGVYISLRGVTTTDQTSKGSPGIQFNTDGIPVNQAQEVGLSLFDAQRIEVLSGPQGTLYGKSSTGGAINVISNSPTSNEEGSVSAEVGNYNTKRIDAFFNEPLFGDWAVRVSGVANDRTGYIQLVDAAGVRANSNTYPGDEDNVVGRAILSGSFTDDLKLRLTYQAGRIAGVGYGDGNASLSIDGGNNITNASLVAQANPIQPFQDDDFQRFYAQLDMDAGPIHAAYLGSYSHYSASEMQSSGLFGAYGQNGGIDAATGYREYVHDSYDETYHELRFSNREPGKLDWVGGINLFYLHTEEDGHGWEIASAVPNCPPNLGSAPFAPPYCEITEAGGNPNFENANNLDNYTTMKSYSAFAHFVYAITPDWHVTVGMREGTDKVTRTGSFDIGPWELNGQGTLCINGETCNGLPNPPFLTPGGIGTENDQGSATFHKFVWNLGTDYLFTPTQFGYLRIATGYKPGGFNDFSPANSNGFAPYGAESMTSYELGYKAHSPVVEFNSSLYFYDYSSEQVNGSFIESGPGGVQEQAVAFTVTTPTRLYGWENGVKWALTNNDLLTASADFEHSKYNGSFLVGGCTGAGSCGGAILPAVQFSGKTLDNTPTVVLKLGLTHTFDLATGAKLELHADTRWSSSYDLSNFDTGVQYRQLSFSRSNANLTYVSASGKLQTELFVTNIENKIQATGGVFAYPSGTTFPGGYNFQGYGQVSQPQFWGIRENIKF
jgi:iron complex outermembrane recepter protein